MAELVRLESQFACFESRVGTCFLGEGGGKSLSLYTENIVRYLKVGWAG